MLKKFFDLYKTPLLTSIVLCIVLVALKVERSPIFLSMIILGSILGTFLLELDYFIYAFFIEPDTDFSKNLRAYLKHRDIFNAFNYISVHAESIKDKTLNSALFQGVLAAACILVVATNTNLFVQALVLSTFVNSIYRLFEHYFKNKLDDWFWAIRINTSNKNTFVVYTVFLFVVLAYSLYLF